MGDPGFDYCPECGSRCFLDEERGGEVIRCRECDWCHIEKEPMSRFEFERRVRARIEARKAVSNG